MLKATDIQKDNEIQLSLRLMGLFEHVCSISQNRSNKIYLFSFFLKYRFENLNVLEQLLIGHIINITGVVTDAATGS